MRDEVISQITQPNREASKLSLLELYCAVDDFCFSTTAFKKFETISSNGLIVDKITSSNLEPATINNSTTRNGGAGRKGEGT